MLPIWDDQTFGDLCLPLHGIHLGSMAILRVTEVEPARIARADITDRSLTCAISRFALSALED